MRLVPLKRCLWPTYVHGFEVSSDLYIRYAVVPGGGQVPLDRDVQADGLQQLRVSLEITVLICGSGNTMRGGDDDRVRHL